MPAVTRDAGTAPETRVPIDVREEVTMFEARVVPVRESAGAEPVMLIEYVPEVTLPE